MRNSIVPPYLLTALADAGQDKVAIAARAARRSLLNDEPFRAARFESVPARVTRQAAVTSAPSGPDRRISTADGREELPGRTVRVEGEGFTGDFAVDEAYDGLGATYDLFADAYGRSSIDDRGMPLLATVHYGQEYDNAFWDGSQMVFGDGDGEVFNRFTSSLSVIGHELSHGVTQHSSNLTYQGQSGSLNESVSDVFGALVEQHHRKQSVAEASWLIGEGLFTSAVTGVALRSMSAPGTAYDDDVLGKDPQPAHMDDFIETEEDNGGVHLNSGIPNRAFYIFATALGGYGWGPAGQVWYDTISGDSLPVDADFSRFSAETVSAAVNRFGESAREVTALRSAWQQVGIGEES
ncbi:M4 family metallopeptidase [Saxibacter everestensis]|uniref:Neutral metalloproteinase n=1 Tax=Saxibacter everestensis TaxID=2909229 RepID=A0ABY8QUL4_9MICO|nr:M4 family metallopeptidase [Brevibacteriaceae bacterium ZFBP1038]